MQAIARHSRAAAAFATAAAVGSLIAALPAQAQTQSQQQQSAPPAAARTPSTDWSALSPWRLYAGAAHIGFSTSAEVRAGGQLVPGADARADSNYSLGFGAIYDFHPGWSAEIALGLPPTTALKRHRHPGQRRHARQSEIRPRRALRAPPAVGRRPRASLHRREHQLYHFWILLRRSTQVVGSWRQFWMTA